MKWVGRVYRQTFIDIRAKVAFARLYDRKTPIAAASLRETIIAWRREQDALG